MARVYNLEPYSIPSLEQGVCRQILRACAAMEVFSNRQDTSLLEQASSYLISSFAACMGRRHLPQTFANTWVPAARYCRCVVAVVVVALLLLLVVGG